MTATQATQTAEEDVPQIPWWRLSLFSVLALAAGVGLTWVLDSCQYERLPGTYDAQPYSLTVGRASVLTKVLVQPGSAVKRGQPVANLTDDVLEDRIKIKEAELKTLEFDLAAAREKLAAELQWRQSTLQSEIFQTRLKSTECIKQRFSSQLEEVAWKHVAADPIQPAAARVYEATDVLASLEASKDPLEDLRIKALLKQGAAKNAEEVASAQLELCDQRIKQLEQISKELPQTLAKSLGVDGVQSRLDQARLELESLERQRSSLTLTATHSGIVGIFRKRTGDRIAADDVIVQILDDSKRYVTFWIDSTRTPDFPVGKTLEVRLSDGWSGEGRIVEIEPQADSETGTPRLAVRLEQAGITWPKQPFGSSVSVSRKR